MNTSPDIAFALATISDRELSSVQATVETAPDIVSGLIAYLEHAVGWKLDRRSGPRAAIDDREINLSLVALNIIVARFRGTRKVSSAVADFLTAVSGTLRAEVDRPEALQ